MSFTLTTHECAQALRTSPKALRLWRSEGFLKPGVHYRAIGPGKVRPTLLWDREATEAALAKRTKTLGV